MIGLSWNRLTGITETQNPYRGTTNRYPVGKRTHNRKDFVVEERNGEKVYVVRYGYTYLERYHTEAEYKANPSSIHHRQWDTDPTTMYCSYLTIPNELGIVRSDNTFEFTAKNYGQGDNQMLSGWSHGWFYRSSRHGGMVYKSGQSTFHPIFKGMRVECDTMLPHKDSEYRVIGKRVSRKQGKEFLKRYQDFYMINEVMLKSMDWKGFVEVAIEVGFKCGADFKEDWYLNQTAKLNLIEFADKNLNEAPLDSCVAYALAHDLSHLYAKIRTTLNPQQATYYGQGELELADLFCNIKRKLNKELYKANPSVMKLVEHTPNAYYPPSEWGVEIYVGDKEVEQY